MLQNITSLSPGDSLSKIAFDKMGDASKWRELAEFNGQDIFEKLPVGKDLQIPNAQDLQAMAMSQVQQLLGKLPGDLGSIAGDLDLSSIASGQFQEALLGKLAGKLPGKAGELVQQFKIIDWLYGS